MVHPEGLVRSLGGGRTDIHNIQVPSGSYVIPADVVSGLSEGNTLGGAAVMDRMMRTNPWGVEGGKMGHGSGPPRPRAPAAPKPDDDKFKKGGKADQVGHLVPIVVAGGEMIYYPNTIAQKFGNLKHGHAVLDAMVKKVRSKNVKTLSKLPGPKK